MQNEDHPFVGVKIGDVNGSTTTSWHQEKALSISDEAPLFRLRFKALSDALLSEAIGLSSRFTKAEAYRTISDKEEIDLLNIHYRFDSGRSEVNRFELYQNVPNPFRQETLIGFTLPEAYHLTLNILDVSGKLLKQVEGD